MFKLVQMDVATQGALDMFKLVHLGLVIKWTPCEPVGKRAVGLRLKGLLVTDRKGR